MRTRMTYVFLAVLLGATTLAAQGFGQWTAAGQLTAARAGHTVTRLADGRLLVAGGEGSTGLVGVVELFNPATGVSQSAGFLASPRKNQAAVLLQDGRVLLTGGEGAGVLDTAEVYNPGTQSFDAVGRMAQARRYHTATLLDDGSVLIAGGNNGVATLASLERFNPASGQFEPLAAVLPVAREQHTATVLQDGRVLIVGGRNGSGALASTDYFAPATQTIAAGLILNEARYAHTATRLAYNAVALIGGTNGTEPRDTAEVVLPEEGVVASSASRLQVARYNHFAVFLPDNEFVMVLGGRSANGPTTTVELLHPFRYEFSPLGSLLAARAEFGGAADSGVACAVGGKGTGDLFLGSIESYAYATIASDKHDYAPGSAVALRGSGWQPGEAVQIQIRKSNGDPDTTLNVFADGQGRIENSSFSTKLTDSGVVFSVSATGGASGRVAYTTFYDSHFISAISPASFTQTSAAVPLTISGGNFSVNFGCGTTFNQRVFISGPGAPGSPQLAINSLSNTIITATIPGSIANVPGAYSVWVQTTQASGPFFHCHCTCFFACCFSCHSHCPFPVTHNSNLAIVTIQVANQAPTANANGPYSVNEGGSVGLSGSGSDPNNDPLSYAWDLDNNGSFETPGQNPTFSAAGRDGPHSQTVRLQVCDNKGACNIATSSVAINNVAPTVVLSGPPSADEGTTQTYSFTVADPGQDTFTVRAGYPVCGTGGSLVPGSLATNAAGGSFQCSFPDGPANPTVSIQVLDSDNAASNTALLAVTVNNVAPTVALNGPATADEGTTQTYNFTVTDPGQDTFSVVSANCGSGGALVGSVTTGASGGSFQCSFPDGPASTPVSIQVADSDGALSNTSQIEVVINNVAPSLSLSGDSTANEGQTKTYTFTVTDPGQDTFTVRTGYPVCGSGGSFVAGSLVTGAGGGSFQCSFPDGPANPTVSIQVLDSDNAVSNNATLPVTVNNVAPTMVLNGPTSTNEGTTQSYSFTVTDPGQDTFTVKASFPSCGTGGGLVAGSLSTNASGGSFQCSFPDGPASSTVAIQVSDSDGADSNVASLVVTVNNVAPANVALVLSAASINENGSVTLGGSFTDPGTLDTHTVIINWDDGSPNTTMTLAAGVLSFPAVPHQYLDDNPSGTAFDTRNITITVTDKDLATGGSGTGVLVNNVAPALGSVTGPVVPLALGSSAAVSVNFTDVGTQDTHTCAISWDDGTTSAGSVTETGGNGSCSASRTYTAAGVYTVTMTVTDDDTGVTSSVFQFIVVYDPNAGFVTGGGWINSPAGAYTADPTLAGKATFGFVSKYLPGRTIPSGNTEFQFHTAGFNFKSTVYEWLVIAGVRAQYKGSGTINGGGDYGFLLTATDGDLTGGGGFDKFRIKIVNKSTGTVIYDNTPGSDDIDTSSQQAIAQGSIVIHKK